MISHVPHFTLAVTATMLICSGCVGCGPTGQPESRRKNAKEISSMQTKKISGSVDAVSGLLRLSSEAYFDFDESTEDKITNELIVMDEFEGTAIGAPGSVDIASQTQLPVLWVRRATGLRSWQVEVHRNSIVVLSDLIRGEISLHNAWGGEKRMDLSEVPLSSSGNRPAPDMAEGATVSAEIVDLRSIANFPWQPGRFAITFIIHDWMSNTALVELNRHGDGLTPDEERAIFFPRETAVDLVKMYKKAASEVDSGISIIAHEKTPRVDKPGVAFVTEKKKEHGLDHLFVHGAAKLPVQLGAIVELSDDEKSQQAVAIEQDNLRAPDAVVGLLLIFSHLDDPEPQQMYLQVPVYSEATLKPGDIVDVAFSIDIVAAYGGFLPAIDLIYLVGGEFIYGPCRT
jgi:hypothetical protein